MYTQLWQASNGQKEGKAIQYVCVAAANEGTKRVFRKAMRRTCGRTQSSRAGIWCPAKSKQYIIHHMNHSAYPLLLEFVPSSSTHSCLGRHEACISARALDGTLGLCTMPWLFAVVQPIFFRQHGELSRFEFVRPCVLLQRRVCQQPRLQHTCHAALDIWLAHTCVRKMCSDML